MTERVYIFGVLNNERGSLRYYSLPQWEAQLPDSASNKEHEEWQDRNPMWGFRDDVGFYLDQDFFEVVELSNIDYLKQYLNDGSLNKLKSLNLNDYLELLIVFEKSLGGFNSKMKDVAGAKYLGEFFE